MAKLPKRAQWSFAICLLCLVSLLLIGCAATFVVVGLWQRPPSFAVVGASVKAFRVHFDKTPAPVMMLRKFNASFELEASNVKCHSAVVFEHLDLRVYIADQVIADIRADGPFRVGATDVLPLGTFAATAIDVPLGDAATRAMEAVHHDVTLHLLGEASTKRTVAGFPIHQTTRLCCDITFSLSYGLVAPFKCKSTNRYLFWSAPDDEEYACDHP